MLYYTLCIVCSFKEWNPFSEKPPQLWSCTVRIDPYSHRRDCGRLCTIKGGQYIVAANCSQSTTLRNLSCKCVTDLFIEREEQSNKQNNAYQKQNLWRWHSVTNWIWWQDKNREMLFICYTKTNFIIHNSLYTRFALAMHTVLLSELSFWICRSF